MEKLWAYSLTALLIMAGGGDASPTSHLNPPLAVDLGPISSRVQPMT